MFSLLLARDRFLLSAPLRFGFDRARSRRFARSSSDTYFAAEIFRSSSSIILSMSGVMSLVLSPELRAKVVYAGCISLPNMRRMLARVSSSVAVQLGVYV